MIKSIIGVFVLILLGGCYPDLSISPVESDSVYTNRHPDAHFTEYKYYRLADSVLRLNEYGEFILGEGQYDQLIIDQVEENLNSRGFIKLVEGDIMKADIDVYISDLSAISVMQFWNYVPYWYYTLGDDSNADAYYPIAPPTSVMQIPISSIMVDMVQHAPSTTKEDDTLSIYWRGLCSGIYDIEMDSRMVRNINQMFFQSPYIKSYE